MTHLGLEARTLSSNPLPHPLTSSPSHTVYKVAQLGEAAIPVESGAGRAAWHSATAKCPFPALCLVSLYVHDWEVRKGLGPRVTEEVTQVLKEKRQRKKIWGGQKTEEPQTGEGSGRDREY